MEAGIFDVMWVNVREGQFEVGAKWGELRQGELEVGQVEIMTILGGATWGKLGQAEFEAWAM